VTPIRLRLTTSCAACRTLRGPAGAAIKGAASCSGWRPATALTLASRIGSAARKTPAFAGCPPASSPSTRRGATATAIAVDLTRWLQLIGLDGDLALAEPKRLRYRILHTPARLARGQRRRYLRIPSTWPWATQITAAFDRIAAIPAPG
jgi:hypothetical protein